jgi:hypothetical protein
MMLAVNQANLRLSAFRYQGRRSGLPERGDLQSLKSNQLKNTRISLNLFIHS